MLSNCTHMPNADELRICVYTCNVVWVVLILGVLKDVASYMWKIMMEFCFGHVVNREVSMITRNIYVICDTSEKDTSRLCRCWVKRSTYRELYESFRKMYIYFSNSYVEYVPIIGTSVSVYILTYQWILITVVINQYICERHIDYEL